MPPKYRLGLEEIRQQQEPQNLSPPALLQQRVPRSVALLNSRSAARSTSSLTSASYRQPIQVPKITSETMDSDVEIVEELSNPLTATRTQQFTRSGDITSSTGPDVTDPQPVLDLTEEMERLRTISREVTEEARNYVLHMNSLGIFVDPSELMED